MLKLYSINNTYVEFLKQFDNRVRESKHRRPYVGVVCIVNGVKYLAGRVICNEHSFMRKELR